MCRRDSSATFRGLAQKCSDDAVHVVDDRVCALELGALARSMGAEGDRAEAGRLGSGDVSRGVTDLCGRHTGPTSGPLLCKLEQRTSLLGLAAEGAFAGGKEALEPKPLQPGPGHGLG